MVKVTERIVRTLEISEREFDVVMISLNHLGKGTKPPPDHRAKANVLSDDINQAIESYYENRRHE